MAWPKGKPRAGTGVGRKARALNKRSAGIEAFAKSVVEDPEVQDRLRTQARQGVLQPPLFQMLFYYAYGRPREQQLDDQAFMEDLLTTVLKHVGPDARQEIRDLIEAHHLGPAGLRVVA